MRGPVEHEAINPRLVEIFRSVVQDPTLELRPDMRRADVAGWDSMAHIRLVLSVEEAFGIRFSTSDIAKFSTIGHLLDLIQQKTAQG